MLRLILFLAFIIALASGLAWLADRPGLIVVNWEGYQAEVSVFHAVVALALLTGLALVAWSILRHIWESPAAIGGYFNRRRQKKGLDALSSGMIAIGAGDRSTAMKYAIQARKSMPNEPLTHLLRAQAAQLSGDRGTARRIYEAMLAAPDTEQLGLRGLFLEAEREGEPEAAKQFAERAVALNPQLSWPVDALFDLQCKSRDWAGALETLAVARKHGHVEKASGERRRAVLLTAQAQDLEDRDPERALNLALDAHKLAPGLVPAAAIAGRLLASRGATPKATKIIQKTWQKAPHPDLATAYAYARLGDSPRDRLDRVKSLAQLNPHSLESAVAVANAAIEAKDYAAARQALDPLREGGRLTQRACTLMARIEGEEHGDKGAVREWLARAVNAPRDPAWTADGVVAEQWSAISPVTGQLDAFQWRVPVESMEKTADEIVARKLEELVALGAPVEVAVAARDVTPTSDSGEVASGSLPAKTGSDIDDAHVIDEPLAAPATKDASQPKAAPPARPQAAAAPSGGAAAGSSAMADPAAAPAATTAIAAGEPPKALEPLGTIDEDRQASNRKGEQAAETPETTSVARPAERPDVRKATEKSVAAAAAVRPVVSEPDADGPTDGENDNAAGGATGGSGGKETGPAAKTTASTAKSAEAAPRSERGGSDSENDTGTGTGTGTGRRRPAEAAAQRPFEPGAGNKAKGASGIADKGDAAANSVNPSERASTAKPAAREAASGGRGGGREPTQKAPRSAVGEARIFVSPRAPDDPGTDGNGDNDVPDMMKPYRVHS